MHSDLFDIKINLIDSNPLRWDQLESKKLMFVNVASECGYTPQYQQLQELHTKFKQSLQIIGIPCNDFGGQEPGSPKDIMNFCQLNYGVEFLISEKVNILNQPHALINILLKQCKEKGLSDNIKWNFHKILVAADGNVFAHFDSAVEPFDDRILNWINAE